ncbi:MAG TPA: peptidase M61 [Bacteroidetes bacterium]|nr:peptidase M61 [Bacteroidota bacterium]
MHKKFIVIAFLISISISTMALDYTVSFDKVKSHYVTVDLTFDATGKDFVDFKVPVWTPGSYKVREFSNAFENVTAGDKEVKRINKNTWSIATSGASEVKLSYDVYSFTVSVRQSYADENYAFLHGVSAFGYLEGYEKEQITLSIVPYAGWNNVEVALPQTKAAGYVFTCDNYDLLADSPIALGNFDKTSYVSGKVPHTVVMIGEGNYDLETIREDFKKISDSQIAMMGDHPSDRYTHFVYNVGNGGGGLEHLNSQTSMMYRWGYTSKGRYRNFLGLIAHEYFHLWNVKRVRPIQLGPFDYDKEVYTDMLWIAEGITSYYDDKTLHRIGLYDDEEYLGILASQINRLENSPGKDIMSLAHSSMLAWVKAYLPTEESMNTTVSYYNKGMIAAAMLDLEIRANGKKSLDDVMTTLYTDFYKKKGRGFTHEEFIAVCTELAGKNMKPFFEDVIFSTKPLDYETIFSQYGISITDKNADKTTPWSGVVSSHSNGKTTITNIYSKSPAVNAGLSVNDEIIAINGWRVDDKLENHDSKYGVNDGVEITYSRDGKLFTTTLTYAKSTQVAFELKKSETENELRKAWLGE